MAPQADGLPRYQLYIDGAWCDAESGSTQPVNEAARGRPMAHIARAGAADVERAVAAARAAFDHGPWPHTPPQERARILHALADAIEERSSEFAETESRNLGVPLRKSTFVDVPTSIDHLRTFAELARRDPYEPLPWTDVPALSWNFVVREPIGVCAQITPWNYPMLMAVWKLAPALATGNCVVMKPASYTPLTTLLLAEVIHESGLLPRGVFNLVTGPGGDVGDMLTAHPGVDKVSFTGSTEVGARIMERAGATIKSVTLELGGKSPSLVMPDADLDLTTDGVLFAAFFNSGQSCEAATRCLVPADMHDAFVARLVERVRTLRLGDPLDFETDLGPIVSEQQAQTIERYIRLGCEEGAQLVYGGRRICVPGFEQGAFIEPTIFAGVHNSMRIAQEEIFGPVLAVIPYQNATEAITIANDSSYGLGGAIWSRDISAAIDIAKRLKTGTVWINDYHVILGHTPFGGYKQSGIGREHGLQGMLEYTQTKRIHVDLHQKRAGRVFWDVTVPEQGSR